MKKIILIFLAFIGAFSGNAQRTCGSHSHLQDQLMANPLLQNQINAINLHAQQYAANTKKTRVLVTIPVVFHILYNTPSENISDAACIANLSQLNLDFARLNADASNTPAAFAALGANTDIQFCLAVRDPLGNATTGITHTATSVTSWSTNNNIKFASSGGVDAWPRDQYLNIWVGYLGPTLLGYGQFPGGGGATDGIVVTTTSVGSQANPSPNGGSYNLGRTATHEVGHWLNMRHVWGDDGGACPGTGGFDDNIADTPPQEDDNDGCPTYPLLDACATVAPGVMFMNYMDYVDDACMNIFTLGQSAVMQSLFSAGGFRAPLLNSLGCVPILPCNGMPNAGTISTNSDTLCSGNAQLFLNGASAGSGISVQWETSTNGTSGWVNASGSSNNITYSAPAIPGVMYYRCTVFCATSGMNASTNVLAIYSKGVTSVAGGSSLCAAGNITLTASGIGTFSWYNSPTSTTPLFIGNPFNTLVPANTTYYVNTGTSTKYNVGIVNKSIGTNSTSNTVTNGLYFKVLTPLTIDTVFVYPGGAGTIVINVQDSITSTSIGSYSAVVTAAQVNTKVAMPISVTINSVGTYKMIASGTTTSLYRNNSGVTFPYTVPNIISITGNLTGNQNQYRYFYDWKIKTGCATNLFAVPVVITAPNLSVVAPFITCNGNTTSITANATGNGYNYFINGGNSNTTGIFNNVSAGTYTISATNASNCSTSTVITLSQPPAILLSATSVNNTGGCNGSIIANATNGINPIQYQINGGAYQSSGSVANLCTGNYTICAIDGNNCSVCTNVLVNSLTDIVVYASTTTACTGASNATITCSVVGGIAPYQYKINTGAFGNANVLTNLGAGVYTITAMDANNVTNTTIATITNSTLAISTSGISVPSATICIGSIIGTATAGTPPYTYSLNSGSYASANSFNNLCAGNYTVCVQDAQGCIVCTNYLVPIIIPIEILAPTLVQPCPSNANGSITANAQLGTSPYQYQLNAGAFTSSSVFDNLVGNIYTITAKDANGITTSTVVLLNKSSDLMLNTLGKIDMSCFNTCNGNIASVVTNGAAPYSYALNGGTNQATGTFGNLCGGAYIIVATDANNCSTSIAYTIVTPPQIDIVLNASDIACNGMTNGSVIVNAVGGLSPYQYKKAPVPYGTYNYFNGLTAGTYTFYLKDKNNCIVSDTASVIEPPVLGLTATSNVNTASITLNATGGTPSYSYSVNGGATTTNNVFTNLAAGTYSLQVTDSRGCQYVTAIVLQAPESIADVQFNNAIGIYPNPSNGIVIVSVNSTKTIGVLQIKVTNTLGQLLTKDIMTVNGKVAEKTLNLQHLPKGSYSVQVIDEHQSISIHRIVVQ